MKSRFLQVDWLLVLFLVPVLGAGLVTMKSFTSVTPYFSHQFLFIGISFLIFFLFSFIDFRFLRRTDILVVIYLLFIFMLLALIFLGHTSNGAKSWFDFGLFSFQPSDLMKLALILVLAKYFSRRHVEIRNIKHIFISALYAIVPFLIVFLQPDFGSAMIIFFIWFGMTLVSGISKRHLLLVMGVGIITFFIFWGFVFKDYQKARVLNFVNPLSDIHGSGYNVYQSTIAVGSGQIFGKGVGFGTQSRLRFLPEYQTDFIFSAFAEEWGFAGVLLLFILLGLIIWRILQCAMLGATNFEILFGLGLVIFISSHIIINVGMNIGLMPVTGITMPFMSYGGSHLITEFMGLGILMGMRRYSRVAHRDDMRNEFHGI